MKDLSKPNIYNHALYTVETDWTELSDNFLVRELGIFSCGFVNFSRELSTVSAPS